MTRESSASIVTDPPCRFITTKEYKRFAEFCDACRRERYIGLCYGLPGVGKTQSARHYSCWEWFESMSHKTWSSRHSREQPVPLPDSVLSSYTVFYTAEVAGNPKRLEDQIFRAIDRFDDTIEDAIADKAPDDAPLAEFKGHTELIIVDEVDRLRVPSLEQLRDIFDRLNIGLVLLGMPGMEKRLSRYPQLYSRVGFVHELKPLSQEELLFLLKSKWSELGLGLDSEDFMDAEAVAAVARITQGNFRLLDRLLTQVHRLLKVNGLRLVTKELVEVARESMVIGLA